MNGALWAWVLKKAWKIDIYEGSQLTCLDKG